MSSQTYDRAYDASFNKEEILEELVFDNMILRFFKTRFSSTSYQKPSYIFLQPP